MKGRQSSSSSLELSLVFINQILAQKVSIFVQWIMSIYSLNLKLCWPAAEMIYKLNRTRSKSNWKYDLESSKFQTQIFTCELDWEIRSNIRSKILIEYILELYDQYKWFLVILLAHTVYWYWFEFFRISSKRRLNL